MTTPQPRDIDVGRVAELDLAHGRVDAVASGDGPQERHQVLGAAGERAGPEHGGAAIVRSGEMAGVGDEAAARLVAEDAVEERGQANRPADVGAKPDRREPGAHGRALAARGAAGRAGRVVGVVGPSPDAVLRLDPQRELGGVGDAENDRSCRLQARDGGGCVLGDDVLAVERSRGMRHPGDGERLLDRARDAEQRPELLVGCGDPAVDLVSLGPGRVEAGRDDRVHAWIATLDQLDVRLDDVARAQLAGANRCGEVERGPLGDLAGLHGGRHPRQPNPRNTLDDAPVRREPRRAAVEAPSFEEERA